MVISPYFMIIKAVSTDKVLGVLLLYADDHNYI